MSIGEPMIPRWIAVALVSLTISAPAVGQKASIRAVDFNNFEYPWNEDEAEGVPSTWHWLEPQSRTRIRLVGGKHKFTDVNDSDFEWHRAPRLTVSSVSYGDLDGDGSDEALVIMNYSTGGTANWDYLYVYKLVQGSPKLLGCLESGSRSDGGLIRAVVTQNHLLILDFADTERRTADCCSDGYIRVRYRWHRGQFLEEGPRERGDLKLQERHPI